MLGLPPVASTGHHVGERPPPAPALEPLRAGEEKARSCVRQVLERIAATVENFRRHRDDNARSKCILPLQAARALLARRSRTARAPTNRQASGPSAARVLLGRRPGAARASRPPNVAAKARGTDVVDLTTVGPLQGAPTARTHGLIDGPTDRPTHRWTRARARARGHQRGASVLRGAAEIAGGPSRLAADAFLTGVLHWSTFWAGCATCRVPLPKRGP